MPFPVPLAKIAETEAALGVTFPAIFKARMSKQNGGEVYLGDDEDPWFLHPFFDTTDRKTLARSASDIRRETERARTWPGFPADGVVIAHDGSGDQLVLRPSVAGELGRDVWLFQHAGGELAKVLDDVAELWDSR